jgi:hypothetical protein
MLRISRDVVVKSATQREYVAVSGQPGIPGDVMTVAFAEGNGHQAEVVQVVASRPIVVDGVVKHELQLSRIGGPVSEQK